ncbi:MAG TPA: dCMP deaminase [Streptosporangiaceae bacterium]|nr:dCMP deaminase [Streptosporangiaceae bacterium]
MTEPSTPVSETPCRAGPGRAGEPPLGCEPGDGPQATVADRRWLEQAVALSWRCPPSKSAFAVGAVLVSREGEVLATGYSREWGLLFHAEEVALAKLEQSDPRLLSATLYSSLEPCRRRLSRPRPCAELVIEASVRRVVVAWLEPPLFTEGGGAQALRDAGITVVAVPELADAARQANALVLSQ